MINNTSLQIHPDFTNRVNIQYEVEYTEKNEPINNEFSNVKKIQCNGLEQAIEWMFRLRQREKYNISVYTLIEIDGQWVAQDGVYCCENFKGNVIEKKQDEEITKLESKVEAQKQELEHYNNFLKKYHAQDQFEQFIKENNNHTYYCRLREPGIGCQPKNGIIDVSYNKVTHNNREYWGSVTYNRILSESELFQYDLDA
jgi:hypothetical protein